MVIRTGNSCLQLRLRKEILTMKKRIITVLGVLMMACTFTPMTGSMHVFASGVTTEAMVTITYEDGCNNEAFEAIKIEVKKGANIPDAGLNPVRDGFLFKGWSPSVTGKATGNVTYVAQWMGDDSLTDADRAAIAANAEKTKSKVSIKDVDGTVVSGKIGEPDDDPDGDIDVNKDNHSDEKEPKPEPEPEPDIDDSYTENVQTGDLNLPLVLGVGASVLVAGSGAMVVLMKKNKEKK